MLAHSKTPDLGTLSYPMVAQPKLDGVRAVVKDGVVLSRTLKPIPNAQVQAALGRPEFEGFDGELIVGLPEAPDCYRQTVSFVMSESKTSSEWLFYAFDMWDQGETPYGLRRLRLATLIGRTTWTDLPITLVPQRRVDIPADVDAYEADLLAAGHEGAILRDLAAPYKFGRSGKKGPLLKVKRFEDFEAEVIGVYEEMHNANEAQTNALGRTERSTAKDGLVGKGTLGGLVLRGLNGPYEGVEFRCGTGFDAAMRSHLWAQHHSALRGITLTGQTAKIKAFPVGAKDKPRHPVFLGWRDMGLDG